MSGRESIENLWDRAFPIGPLLDEYRAEVRHEAAKEIRAAVGKITAVTARAHEHMVAGYAAADLIDPDVNP